tara:strand:+ start:154 stop:783 length:630 start_codon:yes stop_codon:yes gene_type:complete
LRKTPILFPIDPALGIPLLGSGSGTIPTPTNLLLYESSDPKLPRSPRPLSEAPEECFEPPPFCLRELWRRVEWVFVVDGDAAAAAAKGRTPGSLGAALPAAAPAGTPAAAAFAVDAVHVDVDSAVVVNDGAKSLKSISLPWLAPAPPLILLLLLLLLPARVDELPPFGRLPWPGGLVKFAMLFPPLWQKLSPEEDLEGGFEEKRVCRDC